MVIKEVDNEVLIYDLERDKAHCLNPSAAAIWRRCDGKTTPEALAISLGKDTDTRVDEDFIWLGLRDLRRNHLLENDVGWPQEMGVSKGIGMPRREAVRRIGIAAAMALPLVISITSPTAVQAAASCSTQCKPCNTGGDCCSGVCSNNAPGCSGGTKKCT